MTGRADLWIRRTTIGCVALLADRRDGLLPAYAHARSAAWPAWVGCRADAAVGRRDDRGPLLPLCWPTHGLASAEGSCHGRCWSSGAWPALAANVAVAEPTVTGRVIAAWPSFALIGSYELLMRQVRRAASSRTTAS